MKVVPLRQYEKQCQDLLKWFYGGNSFYFEAVGQHGSEAYRFYKVWVSKDNYGSATGEVCITRFYVSPAEIKRVKQQLKQSLRLAVEKIHTHEHQIKVLSEKIRTAKPTLSDKERPPDEHRVLFVQPALQIGKLQHAIQALKKNSDTISRKYQDLKIIIIIQ